MGPDHEDANAPAEAEPSSAIATDELVALLYDELRRIADRYLGAERPDHTLQPTALVNEAYLRLAGGGESRWNSRAHFLGAAARAMRRVLVDHARRRAAAKRPGAGRITLDDRVALEMPDALDLIALDEALTRLAAMSERHARIVELRFFGGLDNKEIAELLDVSTPTVKRDWRLAKTWLRQELGASSGYG